jgi:hypothetical protein
MTRMPAAESAFFRPRQVPRQFALVALARNLPDVVLEPDGHVWALRNAKATHTKGAASFGLPRRAGASGAIKEYLSARGCGCLARTSATWSGMALLAGSSSSSSSSSCGLRTSAFELCSGRAYAATKHTTNRQRTRPRLKHV